MRACGGGRIIVAGSTGMQWPIPNLALSNTLRASIWVWLIGQDNIATVNGLAHALVMACGDQAIVSVQNPARLDRFSEPQPDVTLFRPRADNYRTRERPGPADVLLLVEVADSSLRYDRAVKLPLYARAGIGEVWIVDLRRRVVDVHRTPAGDGYATVATHGPEDTVTLALAPEIAVALRRVFA
jgi:Uma2 family endonuclease